MVIAKTISYRLYCESSATKPGYWRFLLTAPEQAYRLEVSDFEAGMGVERCQLLAILRGLEAIAHRAEVMLITNSRYAEQGLRHGLSQWRASDWSWEHFGGMVPIKHGDLWRRIDHVLQYHSLRSIEWKPCGNESMQEVRHHPLLRVHRLAMPEKISSSSHCVDSWRVDRPMDRLAGPSAFSSRHFAGYTSLKPC